MSIAARFPRLRATRAALPQLQDHGYLLHPAGHRNLLGEVLLGLHHGILDLVVGLHLDDDVLQAAIRLFALKDEVMVLISMES